MAVTRINMKSRHEFVCHSGDEKPQSGVGAGSQITELDTGAVYIWNNGAWEIDLRLIYAIKEAIKQT